MQVAERSESPGKPGWSAEGGPRRCPPGACADLDHTNADLRSHIKEWLNYLKDDVGFEGWRFDFVKGYGPQFIKEYVMETVGATAFNVGEFWVDCRCVSCSDRGRILKLTGVVRSTRSW